LSNAELCPFFAILLTIRRDHMASIENLTLRTLPNPGDVNLLDVRVTFTVFFSEFDFFSHLPYQECIRIFGIDTIAFAGEDNTDDLLIDGFSITTVSPPPRGIPGLNRDVRMAVQRRSLDEDQPPAPNPDELQARITLTPLLPVEVTARSNTAVLSIS
jgi:hypothetical protein